MGRRIYQNQEDLSHRLCGFERWVSLCNCLSVCLSCCRRAEKALLEQHWSRYWFSITAAILEQYWGSISEILEQHWSNAAAALEPGALEKYWSSTTAATLEQDWSSAAARATNRCLEHIILVCVSCAWCGGSDACARAWPLLVRQCVRARRVPSRASFVRPRGPGP